jgi:hypothetical protein
VDNWIAKVMISLERWARSAISNKEVLAKALCLWELGPDGLG